MLFSKSSIVPKGIKGYKNLPFLRFPDSTGKGVTAIKFLNQPFRNIHCKYSVSISVG